MSLKGRLLRLAAAVGLVKPTEVQIAPGTASSAGDVKVPLLGGVKKKKIRTFRHGAFTPKGRSPVRRGNRCDACGTGGHGRRDRHGRR